MGRTLAEEGAFVTANGADGLLRLPGARSYRERKTTGVCHVGALFELAEMKRISWAAVLSTVLGGLVLVSPRRAIAADGALDTTFNGTGIVTTAVGSGADQATGVALQADGKIVVVGYSNNGSNDDFVVVRYNTNGSLDTSFNTTGKVMTPVGPGNDQAAAVAIQPTARFW